MDKFEAMNAFAKVVATRSFAEAGRRLGLTRSAVSKAVMELERTLGARPTLGRPSDIQPPVLRR